MKTIRELLFSLINDSYIDGIRGGYEPSIDLDQALKELKEVILGSLPNKRHYNDNEIVGIFCDGYNQALEDTRKAIKSIIGGK